MRDTSKSKKTDRSPNHGKQRRNPSQSARAHACVLPVCVCLCACLCLYLPVCTQTSTFTQTRTDQMPRPADVSGHFDIRVVSSLLPLPSSDSSFYLSCRQGGRGSFSCRAVETQSVDKPSFPLLPSIQSHSVPGVMVRVVAELPIVCVDCFLHEMS